MTDLLSSSVRREVQPDDVAGVAANALHDRIVLGGEQNSMLCIEPATGGCAHRPTTRT